MAEQNFGEMLKMQNEAKNRVLEMQNRSRFAADQMNKDLHVKENGGRAITAETKDMSNETSVKATLSRSEETERMFILALCMLLSAEEADEALIVALMYLLT